MKKILIVMMLAFVMVFACSCGGGSSESAETEAADSGQDVEFLLGTWISTTVTVDDQEMDAAEALDGKLFVLIFNEDGTCTMSRDSQNSYVDWTLNDDGSITLKGDNTYQVTFTDDSKTEMYFEFEGMGFTLEKQEE